PRLEGARGGSGPVGSARVRSSGPPEKLRRSGERIRYGTRGVGVPFSQAKESAMPQHKILLDESQLPQAWYNINADLPVPPQPVLHPGTKEPVTPDFLSVLFPMSLILQEVSGDRWIEIPEPVRDIYRLWRPAPMYRALRLEKAFDTPAHSYYKYEGVSPVGSHKPNTAVAQAFYNKEAGTKALTTETGAGQWGSALAMACNMFGLDLEIYMVKVS